METSFVNNASRPPQNFADAFPCPLSERMSVMALPEGKADIMISILEMTKVALVTRGAGWAGKGPLLLPSSLAGGLQAGSSPPPLSPAQTSHLCWAPELGARMTPIPGPCLSQGCLPWPSCSLRTKALGLPGSVIFNTSHAKQAPASQKWCSASFPQGQPSGPLLSLSSGALHPTPSSSKPPLRVPLALCRQKPASHMVPSCLQWAP